MNEGNVNETIIKLEGLTKRFGYGDATSYALKNFDLEVKRGEFIMIMGPSGCGKTTLLNIIGLLDSASSGVYLLNDEPVSRIPARRQARLRAKKIGFIFQNFNLKIYRFGISIKIQIFWHLSSVAFGKRKKKSYFKKKQVIRELY